MFSPASWEAFEREVGATPVEFERSLQKAAPGAVSVLGNGHYLVECGNVSLSIKAAPMPPRRIALFSLPVLKVNYRFSGGDDAARKSVLERLDRAMQRGGG